MKTIILATNFSDTANNAAEYAADMALAVNADLLLFHVYTISSGYPEVPLATNTEEILKATSGLIAHLKDELLKRTGYKINVNTMISEGVFFEGLKTVCDRVNPYAVIMGNRDVSFTEHLLLGTHAVQAMKHLKWPVITVPQQAAFSGIKKIAFACDFDAVADTVPADVISRFTEDLQAKLYVVNTGKMDQFSADVVFQTGVLESKLLPLRAEYVFLAEEKNTNSTLFNFIAQSGTDLLIVLPKKHSLLERITQKSHTKELMLHSNVPVLALHKA